ncbi:MAG TPA: tetratricopeptide repeat protein [Pirellulales bacterium]|nr:tetratricopeptide repeat protein [Pirellulales bacterium]
MRTWIVFAHAAALGALLLVPASRATAADAVSPWKGAKVLPKLGAQVMVDDRPIDHSGFTLPWVVQDEEDERLLVGGTLKGWVDADDVVTLDDAPEYYSQFMGRYRYEAWAYGMRAFALREQGKILSALADYDIALRQNPSKWTFIGRGLAYDNHHDFAKALADFNQARRIDPKFALAFNNAAWLMATCADEHFRDGKQAVELATRSCELSDWKDASHLDTLAAAYAEAGDYDAAVKWQNKALEIEPDNAELKDHAALFKDHKPVREVK